MVYIKIQLYVIIHIYERIPLIYHCTAMQDTDVNIFIFIFGGENFFFYFISFLICSCSFQRKILPSGFKCFSELSQYIVIGIRIFDIFILSLYDECEVNSFLLLSFEKRIGINVRDFYVKKNKKKYFL